MGHCGSNALPCLRCAIRGADGAARRPYHHAAASSPSPANTFLPFTIVPVTRPFNVQLWKGLFFDLLALVATSKSHSASGLKMVTSASAPGLSVPFFRLSRRAGAVVYLAITS